MLFWKLGFRYIVFKEKIILPRPVFFPENSEIFAISWT